MFVVSLMTKNFARFAGHAELSLRIDSKKIFRRGDRRAPSFLTVIASSYNGKRFVTRRCITSRMDRMRAGARSAR
jgi:hypothetical protein